MPARTGKKIAFIGLGQMGRWMAANLVRRGFDLTVHDIRPEAMELLAAEGAVAARSPAEAVARADWVFLSLPDEAAIAAAASGENGFLPGARPGQAVVDFGTTPFLWTRQFAEKLAERGIRFADAPVTGLEERAREGTLTLMFGGAPALLEELRPALSAVAGRIVPMGATGSGQLAKMVNNILYNANIAALAEVLPMAVALGLDPERVAEVVTSGSGRSFAAEYFVPKILERRFNDSYPLGKAWKDMAAALEISERRGIPLPVVRAAADTYRKALASGWSEEDKGAMVKVFEDLLGVAFSNK
jgi:3-hydroxyisobutyrate dehydrogenase-like beta-hydroxyacid dehydrogenase